MNGWKQYHVVYRLLAFGSSFSVSSSHYVGCIVVLMTFHGDDLTIVFAFFSC